MAIQLGDIVEVEIQFPQDNTIPDDNVPIAKRIGKVISDDDRYVFVEFDPCTTEEVQHGAKIRLLKGQLKPIGPCRWITRLKVSEMR